MTAYYNEIDPYAAQWLRNLIAAGHIAPGDVDERSIEDVRPEEIRGMGQCHFFAGIGVWSKALRDAGWDDSRPVWTGSCPCQPFSAAGKGAGFADERHLWPAWFHLIGECKPPVIFGEQVAGKNGLAWLDLVQADVEGLGYACGAVVAPAAGFGAPHIRERLYWTAYADDTRPQGRGRRELQERADKRAPGPRGSLDRLGHTESSGRERWQDNGDEGRRERPLGQAREAGGLAELKSEQPRRSRSTWRRRGEPANNRIVREELPNPNSGVWGAADWLYCTDGKWRPVEPGLKPLAHGVASRVGQLRAYGNAICAPQARAFIEAAMEYRP